MLTKSCKFFTHFQVLWLLLLLVMLQVEVKGECNVCSVANDLACVSKTTFKACVNSSPTGAAYTCPTGYVCSTANATICQPNQPDVVVACNSCNRCDADRTFACTGISTFALCLGTVNPSDITGSCAPNYVCNVHHPQICGSPSNGIAATCPYSTTTTTTVKPISSTPPPAGKCPERFCKYVRQNGRFRVGADLYTTCKQYVYCFVYGGVWSGQLYTCPGKTFFNSRSKLCETSVPAYCSRSVSRLWLEDF